MNISRRRELASRLLDGYVHGPAAATEATARALAKVPNAAAVVLVESISDQIAVETLAARRGRDRAAGAQLRRFLGSGSTRKLRYARLLAGAVDLGRLPHPLDGVLAQLPATH